MGVILHGKIAQIINKKPKTVVVGGKAQIKNAMCILLKHCLTCEIRPVADEIAKTATAVGMVKIY